MAYDKKLHSMLRSDRDDALRAEAFDEAYPKMDEQEKAYCDRALVLLGIKWELSERQAKALLADFIVFMHMKVDEQDRWREHGEAVQRRHEWLRPTALRRHLLEELV